MRAEPAPPLADSAAASMPPDIYRALFEVAADGLFISGAQGRYVDVNARGSELVDYTRAEVLQLSMADLVSRELHLSSAAWKWNG